MSHSVVVVLIPKVHTGDLAAFQKHIELALEPFNEHTEVPEYDEPCYCVGNIAQSEIRGAGEKQWPLDQLREAYRGFCTSKGISAGEESEEANAYWQTLIGPRERWEEAKAKEPLVAAALKAPDPECEECKGGGTSKSTYNPLSKWDWYAVGGRWDGQIQGENRADGKDFRDFYAGLSDGTGSDLANNCLLAHTLKKAVHKGDLGRLFFAILDLEGKWHQQGDMGWFGMASNEKSEKSWQEEYVEVLDKCPEGTWAVAVDVHI